MESRIVCIAYLAVIVIVTTQGNPCYEGWVYFNGACYGYGETPVSWAEAAAACSLMNANLVEIETANENSFVKMMLKNRQVAKAWIGGTDMFDEGNWVWITRKSRINSFSDWYTGQPSEASTDVRCGGGEGNGLYCKTKSEDCLSIASNFQYQWDDAGCALIYNFVCETHVLEIIVG